MTELAILGVSSAGVTITVAIVVFILGRRASDAERQRGTEAVRATSAEGKLLAASLTADGWKAKAGEQKDRADALQTLLEQTVDDLPPGGARERLHARWFAIHHPATVPTADHAAVQVSTGPDTARSDELLKPGE